VGAALLAVAAAACGVTGNDTSSVQSKGIPGQTFTVKVSGETAYFNPATGQTVYLPNGGLVTAAGGIDCGMVGGVGHASCSADYPWGDASHVTTVVLTATPDAAAGYAHYVFAGACTAATGETCTVTGNATRLVMVRFAKGSDELGSHPNFTAPAVHGPAFLDRLAGAPTSLDCTSSRCHGPTYDGTGFAPSCNACHASAGWTSWRSNCTFCHGTRVKSGYAFAADPAKAAPPDAVAQRLTGSAAPARTGAHQQHLAGVTFAGERTSLPFRCETCHPVPADLSHVGGAAARAAVALSPAGQASLPASLGAYDPGAGTCSTYCHGDGHAAGTSPAFAATAIACDGCHGVPPASGHPSVGSALTVCATCHPETMSAAGTIRAADGKHVDGAVQIACGACHALPPPTGAHVAHFGLAGADASGYGDTRALEDMFPGATPATAPAVYAFGCGSCHPLDASLHGNDLADVVLHEAAAPAGSLKHRSPPTAAYDRGAGTCSDVYCHSSGQAAPAYRTTPAWTSGTGLACRGCHDDPPRYASGGAGTASANSHLDFDLYGWETGHFSGMPGPAHPYPTKHGGASAGMYGDDPFPAAAPITCQACHAETVDPANVAAGGFFWLDTTGDYRLPGGDPARLGAASWLATQCSSCHGGAGSGPVLGGRVLPLRHVNGRRDVAFDRRAALPAGYGGGLPPLAGPVPPYYVTYFTRVPDPNPGLDYWELPEDGVLLATTAASKPVYATTLEHAAYEPDTKTCSNVGCHVGRQSLVDAGLKPPLRWGARYQFGPSCSLCHEGY
jgi:predicted CxxxxCH...CXXCH cytochrome family protein